LEVTETGALVEPNQAELATLRMVAVVERGTDMHISKEADTQIRTNSTVHKYVARVVKARTKCEYVKALKKLQRGRDLLQGQESPLLCLHIGQVRAYFGEWTEAELKRGLKFQLENYPSSELALQLSNSLLELNHQREMRGDN